MSIVDFPTSLFSNEELSDIGTKVISTSHQIQESIDALSHEHTSIRINDKYIDLRIVYKGVCQMKTLKNPNICQLQYFLKEMNTKNHIIKRFLKTYQQYPSTKTILTDIATGIRKIHNKDQDLLLHYDEIQVAIFLKIPK